MRRTISLWQWTNIQSLARHQSFSHGYYNSHYQWTLHHVAIPPSGTAPHPAIHLSRVCPQVKITKMELDGLLWTVMPPPAVTLTFDLKT